MIEKLNPEVNLRKKFTNFVGKRFVGKKLFGLQSWEKIDNP
jgi:hypothetical protein